MVSLFAQRMVDIWKSLPEEVVKLDMITVFRRHLNKHLNRLGARYRVSASK